MAGGKETPRQKMIGMMYLVLTALLALNVSKEIINAFVTLNNKMELSNQAIKQQNQGVYNSFDEMLQNPQTSAEQKKNVKFWQDKALEVQGMAKRVINHYITEASEMIKMAEGKSWIAEDDGTGYLSLLPLADIQQKDNYDIPTNMFIGPNMASPKERGLELIKKFHNFRDSICITLASYEKGDKQFSFTPIDTKIELEGEDEQFRKDLREAMSTVNPEDTAILFSVYSSLTLPEKVENYNEKIAWIGAQFDHAPLVAAAAIFTSLKGDLLRAEGMIIKHINSKVDAPPFKFNKIDPLTSANTAYLNEGDSLDLKVMIAAYDSTKAMELEYWIDDSTKSEAGKKTFNGKPGDLLKISGGTGDHKVYGNIAVEVQGQKKWLNWTFPYKVGKPSAAIALPEMLTLYKGYDNKVKVSASGYPPESISASCSGCASFSKKGEFYIAKPKIASNAPVTVSVSAKTENGTASIGSEQLSVTDFPVPTVLLAGSVAGSKLTRRQINDGRRILLKLVGSPLKASFTVNSFSVIIGNKKVKCNGSSLNNEAMALIGRMQPGQTLAIQDVNYSGTGTKRVVSGSFEIR